MAMLTTASASIIATGVQPIVNDPIASVRTSRIPFADRRNLAFLSALGVPGARSSVENFAAQASPSAAPSISPGGIVPIDSTTSIIQPGEWVSIYGTNLAAEIAYWNGNFPTSLGGVQVEINGKLAYLSYVSPGQIDLQAPDDNASGVVSVVVTTPSGSAASSVTLSQFAPSFSLIDKSHVSGIILRSDGSGKYGGGAYDILGPSGAFLGYPTVAAQPGDNVEIFGFGFGPTTPAVLAGKPFSGSAPIDSNLNLSVGDIPVRPTFAGISSAGLYQINFVVPIGLPSGDVPIFATIGGMQTQSGVSFPVQNIVSGYPVTSGSTAGGTWIGSLGGSGGGTVGTIGGGGNGGGGSTAGGGTGGGGSGGGSGGGGSIVRKRGMAYLPKLRFGPRKTEG